jgi:hypothetical protein
MNIAMTNSYQIRTTEILCEDALIPSDTAGIRLHLRRKHPADVKHFPAERTVLIMHGASFSSMSLFDVPVGGSSFMDHLALAGFDVLRSRRSRLRRLDAAAGDDCSRGRRRPARAH